MYDIIGYHNILYVPSCMTLLVNIIYYMFMYDIIGYHNILYVRSCMTVLVIIIYYEVAWVLVPTPLILVPTYPSTKYTYPKYQVLGGEHHS